MIVASASFENGRTVWRFERESGDEFVPQSALWIDGQLHRISSEIETVWLALVLGPFAGKRIVVPGAATAELCGRLATMLGVAIEAAGEPLGQDDGDRLYRATLIRDPLDLSVAGMTRVPPHFAIGITSDAGQFGYTSTTSGFASNAGMLRRYRWPLDRVGELATLWMLGPTLSLRCTSGYLWREELGDLALDALVALAAALGVNLRLPFAQLGAPGVVHVLLGLGMPPVACFHGLWHRYRMFPELMGSVFEQMSPFLGSEYLHDPVSRISAYMARSVDHKIAKDVDEGVEVDVTMFMTMKARPHG